MVEKVEHRGACTFCRSVGQVPPELCSGRYAWGKNDSGLHNGKRQEKRGEGGRPVEQQEICLSGV